MDWQTMQRVYRRERIQTFVIMWFVYVAYYLVRKNYAVAMPALLEEYNWTKQDVGVIMTANFAAYAVGQFLNGFLGDRLGSKLMICTGLSLSILANWLFPLFDSVPFLMLIWGVNGYAQSSGWPCSVKVMGCWFSAYERGTVMGFWSTCYQAGGILASLLAAFFLACYGWQFSFFGPSLVVAGILALYLLWQKEKPEDHGLINVEEYHRLITQQSARAQDALGQPLTAERPAAPTDNAHSDTVNVADLPAEAETKPYMLWNVLGNKTVLAYGMAYFFLKFIRYSLLFWLPLYMVEKFRFGVAEAGIISTLFEVGGIAGTIFAGWVSDKYFQARRAPISVLMLLGLAVISFLYMQFGGLHAYTNVVLIVFLGFMLYGPDSVMSGTGAIDAVSKAEAATAAGFVNGMGSVGQALQGLIIAYISDKFGWDKVFFIFIVFSLIASICVSTRWYAKPHGR
jgi:sugar phosphate permease